MACAGPAPDPKISPTSCVDDIFLVFFLLVVVETWRREGGEGEESQLHDGEEQDGSSRR
jgi:hypothetical protein